jgi:Protein of unknown function (DUF3276)
VEYGHFSRKDRDFRDRDRGRSGDRDRGGDNRDRDRGGFRDNRGGPRPFERDRDRGGFSRDRDRGNDRSNDREFEESVFSKKVRAGKRRTYFFDVRKTRGEDYFITITESTRREDGYGYKRHKIFLYKEDFNRFVASLNEVVSHVKTDLMPNFDYEEFDRRQAEWEAQNRDADEEDDFEDSKSDDNDREERHDKADDRGEQQPKRTTKDDDDDVSW